MTGTELVLVASDDEIRVASVGTVEVEAGKSVTTTAGYAVDTVAGYVLLYAGRVGYRSSPSGMESAART